MMFPHNADVTATIKACERAHASISSLPLEYQLGSQHPTYVVFGCATAVRGRFVDVTMGAREVGRTVQVMLPAKHGFNPGDIVCVTVQLGRSNKGGLVGFAVSESPSDRTRVRFVALVRSLVDDGMSVRQACMKVGIDTSRFARLEAGQGEVGIDQIRKTCKRMRLALSFFEDPSPAVDIAPAERTGVLAVGNEAGPEVYAAFEAQEEAAETSRSRRLSNNVAAQDDVLGRIDNAVRRLKNGHSLSRLDAAEELANLSLRLAILVAAEEDAMHGDILGQVDALKIEVASLRDVANAARRLRDADLKNLGTVTSAVFAAALDDALKAL